MGDTETLATARRLAEDTNRPVRMRLSAIAAVGQLGDKDCLAELKKFEDEGNPIIKVAAKAAIKKLEI